MARPTLAMVNILDEDVARAEAAVSTLHQRLDKVFTKRETTFYYGKLAVAQSSLRGIRSDVQKLRRILVDRRRGGKA